MAENAVTHKVAAILAADAVGYSRLMADDEPATIDALDAARAIFTEHIEANQGRVVDTAGDSVLAIFETAAGAVLAAVAVQERLEEINEPVPEVRRMPFRIGLHLGDIREKADGTVYGDGVNIAARLEGIAAPGGIAASEMIRGAVESRLDIAFTDLGEHEVKNIAEPVRAYSLGDDAARSAKPKPRTLPVKALAAAAVVLVAGAAAWLLTPAVEPIEVVVAEPDDPILAMPSGPSIAVLPFDYRSEGDGSEYFADGLVEDIITALSRFPDFMVFARNTTFQYKGEAVTAQQVHQKLGADYVLEGSVRRDDDRLRVSAQLTDGKTGAQVWAESFDRELTGASIFDLQDEITRTVVATLADTYGVITRVTFERARGKGIANLESYECVSAASAYWRIGFTEEMHLKVRDCLENTVEREPEYTEAWVSLGFMYMDETKFGFNLLPNAMERAAEAARTAIKLNRKSQGARLLLAETLFFGDNIDAFYVEAERALSLNPNSADALSGMGTLIASAGDWDRGAALLRKAIALDPNYPSWYHFVFGHKHAHNKDFEAALSEYLKVDAPDFFWTHANLASVYGHLGKLEDATRALDRLFELYPDFAANFWVEGGKWNWRDEDMQRLGEGLEKAGLDIPEPTN